MNTSNKLRGIHSTRLGRDQIVKERCPRCRGTKSCLRCPGTYQLVIDAATWKRSPEELAEGRTSRGDLSNQGE